MAEALTPGICVVGGGPGGIAAALAAATAKIPVVLVERGQMGGAAFSSGAVPSKALIAAADIYESLRLGPAVGVTGAPLQVNLAKVRDHIVAATEAVAPRVSAERLAAQGVRVISGEAAFRDRMTLAVGDITVRAGKTILAVGSVPAVPAIQGLDDVDYMTVANGAFDLSRKPAHLIVLGAGRYALELAQAYNRLGMDASVLSDGPVLPEDDPELAALVAERLRAEGIRMRTNVSIRSVARRKGGIRFFIEEPAGPGGGGEATVDGSHLLIATGRGPDIGNLNLSAGGIAYDSSGITVDRRHRTTNPAVFAIGDATAGPATATRAEVEAERVVKAIASRMTPTVDVGPPPSVVFTDPALATVGYSEMAARSKFKDVRTLRFPFAENDRAQIERLPAGMIKVVTTEGGRIVGAAIVGRDAGELIGLWSLAVANGLTLADVAEAVPAYPTRSAIARRVATLPEAGLTSQWRRRIIGMLRNFG